ncbi:hypothetical protein L6164_028596 [Bauhinia variegata]|uniref:Uncharacterized protein n=1 Tax=Bauhinia variegata TaxID=167791 RepID=A0ACB9L654_BAUVA|nr:hypothetical protein L6164_028596 [Bauhinia variegata]
MESYQLTTHCSSHSFQSVQELIKKPLPSVPQSYLCLNDDEPFVQNETLSMKLPIIDMKKLVVEKDSDSELEKLHSACKDWGFFQLVNHGLSPPMLEKLKDDTQDFFNLSMEEKMKYKIRPGDFEGYGVVMRSDNEKLDWGDRLYMITNPVSRRKPYLFPELPSSFRTTLDSYLVELQNIAMVLMGLMSQALKLDKRELVELFEDGMQSMRITYYPPCPQPNQVIGLTAHSDGSGITILNQVNGVHGLQVKKEGIWIPVNVLSDALIVNVGDILEILSNGAYKSVEHRVRVNSDKERISIAMFFSPKFESEIGPLINLTEPSNHDLLFKRIGMEKFVNDFFSRKLNGKTNLEPLRIKNEDLPTP